MKEIPKSQIGREFALVGVLCLMGTAGGFAEPQINISYLNRYVFSLFTFILSS